MSKINKQLLSTQQQAYQSSSSHLPPRLRHSGMLGESQTKTSTRTRTTVIRPQSRGMKASRPKHMHFWYYLQFSLFTMKNCLSQNCKKYFSTRNMYIWAKTFPYTAVRKPQSTPMQTLSSEIHPAGHSNANRTKPRSNKKTTDKHAAEYSKAVRWNIN